MDVWRAIERYRDALAGQKTAYQKYREADERLDAAELALREILERDGCPPLAHEANGTTYLVQLDDDDVAMTPLHSSLDPLPEPTRSQPIAAEAATDDDGGDLDKRIVLFAPKQVP